MRRFADHFVLARPADAAETAGATRQLPAERELGRPTLERGSFRGLPIWYHTVEAASSLRTDDGRLFDLDDAIACFQFEHYVSGDGGPTASDEKTLRSFYYRLKPFLPRTAQLSLQRVNARRRLRDVVFPRWPADDTLNALFQAGLAAHMRQAEVEALPFLGFWPNGMTWAWSLTHDVDTLVGQRHAAALARVEEERGLRSCWYFVPERYPVDLGLMSALRERGHEIGVHGLRHSGNLFDSRAEFDARLPRINAWVRKWGAVGFRSPATYRNPYWLPDIDVDYDSSYMDNATLEPQRGGVCGTFPFMLSERMVELPITLPMDHTLLNVLQQDVAAAFRSKLDWIRPRNGLAMSLFHPDYNTSAERRHTYAAVIDDMRAVPGGWYALPREIAAWWQRRRRSMVVIKDGCPVVVGPAAGEGRVWWARLEGDALRIDTGTQTIAPQYQLASMDR
jgi:peptidoglycan/xylan/chitin deacetylase (PgdA/CDA1 family)